MLTVRSPVSQALLALAVGAALVLLVGRGRTCRRQLVWMAVGFAVPVSLWVCRNLLAFGTPVALLGIDRNVLQTVGGRDPYSATTYETLWSVLSRKPEVVVAKLDDFAWPFQRWQNLFGSSLGWLPPAFVAASASLLWTRDRALRPWAALLVAFCVRTLILTLTHHELRSYASYVPLLLVFVFGAAWSLLERWLPQPRLRTAALALAIAALLAPQLRGMGMLLALPPAESRPLVDEEAPPDDLRDDQRLFEAIRRYTPPSAVIASHWTRKSPGTRSGR